MSIHHAIWTVGAPPVALSRATLPSERALEEMIVAAPQILSDSWMLIGRQERTAHGGIIDLLAIAPDGALVLIELKRERTPRDVVAQALDYASWVEGLKPEDIAAIHGRFAPGRNLANDFRARFGTDLDEEMLNHTHEVVIVAAELDADSERIVTYLADRGIAINVLCFQVFTLDGRSLLSRAWLKDRVEPAPDAVPASGLTLPNDAGEPVPALDVLTGADYHRHLVDDVEKCEWFVPVAWDATLPLNRAVREIGLFGNQNTVCRPTTPKWRTTVERLKTRFLPNRIG